MNWRTIDSAPKDTAILVWSHSYTIAHLNTALGGIWVGLGHNTSDTRSLKQFPPTHWMSLPEKPLTNGEQS